MSFESDLQAFADKAKGKMDTVVRKVTIEVGNSLVMMSPVDTGRFRGNWQHGVDVPNPLTTLATDKIGTPTMARLQSSAVGAGTVQYITNSLPYAVRLENGWSKQAPQGMVRITAARFRNFLRVATVGI